MNASDFLDKLIDISRQVTTLNGIQVVDKDGKPIEQIKIDFQNKQIILK